MSLVFIVIDISIMFIFARRRKELEMERVLELASKLGRNLVFFDVEHTGGTTDSRRIIEFGAYVVSADGSVTDYSSLVSVPRDTVFNFHAMKANKINRKDLVGKPTWKQIYIDFVQQHSSDVWIGFNSNGCDTPIIKSECHRHGLNLPGYQELDLMKNPVIGLGLSGSLSVRLKKIDPMVNTQGMHRALKDAWMTMALLDGLLSKSTDALGDVLTHLGVSDGVERKPFGETDLNALPAFVGSLVKKGFEDGGSLDELAERFSQPKKAIVAYLTERGLIKSSSLHQFA